MPDLMRQRCVRSASCTEEYWGLLIDNYAAQRPSKAPDLGGHPSFGTKSAGVQISPPRPRSEATPLSGQWPFSTPYSCKVQQRLRIEPCCATQTGNVHPNSNHEH